MVLGYRSPEEIKIKVVKRMSLQISGFFQGFEIIKKWCDLKNFISRKNLTYNYIFRNREIFLQ